MNDITILQELDLPLFILRDQEIPAAVIPVQAGIQTTNSGSLDPRLRGDDTRQVLTICVTEIKSAFSEAHQTQLTKIMDYLGYPTNEYSLCFADDPPVQKPLIAFGKTTYSISQMLSHPACKREVLNAIQAFKRNA